MLAFIMASNWIVLHYPDQVVVTSDRALAPIETPHGTGYAVPIDSSATLLLTRCTERRIAVFRDGTWWAQVSHRDLEAADGVQLRQALAAFSMNAIFGPSEDSVAVDRRLLAVEASTRPDLIVHPFECDAACHLYDYFRAASGIRVSPDEAQAAADRADLDAVLPTWRTPIAVQLNHVERTAGGVHFRPPDSLILSLALGLDLHRVRGENSDLIRGGFLVAPFEHMRNQEVSLGNMCRQAGRRASERTYLHNLETGNVRTFDLRPYLPQTSRGRKGQRRSRKRDD